jgi:pimeloyl-ACP methyl ester carboxylesterase
MAASLRTEMQRTVRTKLLEIAFLESGPAAGAPVILLHGWPSDVHDFDDAAAALAADGCRVLVPWLRGYGPTRFLDTATPRSGQQATLGADVRDFMDALGIRQAVVGGYDWGGRAACVVAALWPERVRALVTINGYAIQNIAASGRAASAEQEHRYWYQWYFHTERGRAGLTQNRREIARLLWRLWSPNWAFHDATFDATAASFDNPDFVDVTIQSYRHRFGYAPGDPALEAIERQLATRPKIAVPTIALQGEDDGVQSPEASEKHADFFTGPYRRDLLPKVGHNPPQEAPRVFADAVVELVRGAR